MRGSLWLHSSKQREEGACRVGESWESDVWWGRVHEKLRRVQCGRVRKRMKEIAGERAREGGGGVDSESKSEGG